MKKKLQRFFVILNNSFDFSWLFHNTKAQSGAKCTCSYCTMASSGGGFDEHRNKRKPEDLSSDEDGDTSKPAEKKKMEKTPVKSSGLATSSGQANPPNSHQGGATNVVPSGTNQTLPAPSFEELNEVCTQMSQELGNLDETEATGDSYASKTRRVRKFYPYTVYVVCGDATREYLEKNHYVGFENFIFQAKTKLSFEENKDLLIDWCLYKGSYAMVACANKKSALWVKSQVAVFTYEQKITRSYFQWERSEAILYSVFLQGSFWKQKHMKPNWVLGQIFRANNLKGSFRNVTYDTKRNANGVFLEWEPIEADLISSLGKMTTLNCLTCNPTLRQRRRRARTEAEFLEFLRTDPGVKAQNLTIMV